MREEKDQEEHENMKEEKSRRQSVHTITIMTAPSF